MTKDRLARFLNKYNFTLCVPQNKEQIAILFNIAKSAFEPSYKYKEFKKHFLNIGFNVYVKDKNEIIVIWCSRYGKFLKKDAVFVELTWCKPNSHKAILALAYIAFNLLITMPKMQNLVYYSKKNPWRKAIAYKNNYYIFNRSRII